MASRPSNGRRRPPRAVTVTAVALCSCLLASCGGSSKGPGPGGGGGDGATSPPGTSAAGSLPADRTQKAACGLVSQAEVEAALGAKVNPGKESVAEARSLCGFSLAAAADQSVVLVSTTSSGVPAAFDAAREKAESPQAVNAGDQAFAAGAQALVRKGDTMVAILVAVRQPQSQLTPVATKLAQAVGTHL